MHIDRYSGLPLSKAAGYDANAYARRLAGYISDVSTIRAHMIREYGFALGRDEILAHMEEARKPALDYGPAIGDEPVKVGRPKAKLAPLAPKPVRRRALPILPSEFVDQVARVFDMRGSDLTGKRRTSAISRVRNLAVAILYARAVGRGRVSLTQIAKWVNRDHSTISHALAVFSDWRRRTSFDPVAKEMIDTYSELLEEWGLEDAIYEPRPVGIAGTATPDCIPA